MFKEVVILIVLVAVLQQITKISSEFDKVALEMMLAIIIAFNANFWLTHKLKGSGYEFVGIIHSNDIDQAKIEAIEDLDKNVFSDKFIDPKMNKQPHILKKIYSLINKIR